MEYFQARLDSFSKSKRSKTSSARHASSSSKWPHPSSFEATPNSLAEAGFYFDPDSKNPDNVTCFMCKKGVAGWEPEDDPFSIHYDKCATTCAWAMVRCQRSVDGEGYDFSDSTRHPTSKAIEKARLETFSKVSWPHDVVKGHGANSKALAKAGFICNSTKPNDDTAFCLYCNLSLGGWDEDDDPYEEHLKRDKKKGTSCAFLQAYVGNSLGKSTVKRPTSKAASKPPLRSASQTLRDTITTEAEAPADDDDELTAIPSDLSAPIRPSSDRQSKTSSVRASSATAKTPASRRSTRGTSTAGKTSGSRTVSSDVEDTEGGSESDAGRRSGKSKKTGGRTKFRVSAIAEEEDEAQTAQNAVDKDAVDEDAVNEDAVMQDPESQPGQDLPKRKRGRPPKSVKPAPSSKANKAAVSVDTEDVVAETDVEIAPLAPSKKNHTRTRSKANVESEAETAPSSSKRTHTRTKSGLKSRPKQEEDEEEFAVSVPVPKKNKQTSSKTGDGDEEEVVFVPPKKSKGRAVSRSKVKEDIMDATLEQKLDEQLHARTESERSATSRGPKSSHESKSSLSEDAGYATAEPPPDADPMDVDGPSPPFPRPFKMKEPLGPAKAQGTHAQTASRSTPVEGESEKRPGDVTNGLRYSSVASSSRPSSSRPPSRLNKDTLKVIEIDSDGEETGMQGPPAKAAVKGKAPLSRGSSPTSINVSKNIVSQASRNQSQVEVVISPLPKRLKALEVETVDVQMRDQSPTSPIRTQVARGAAPSVVSEPESPGPGTPVSAAHRSALPSPVRAGDVRGLSPEADGLFATASKSPPTYHPFLAELPIEKLSKLTEEETEMTLEQYIRQEVEIQYAHLKADGERRIDDFKQKAAEAKRLIESS